MKIAVPYLEGQVFPHFGQAEEFKIYDTVDDEILSTEIVKTAENAETAESAETAQNTEAARNPGGDHAALADLLVKRDVNVLICGGIGMGAVAALKNAGIQILGGASGEADARVTDFLGGTLHFDTAGSCASCSSCTSSCASCGLHGGVQPDGGEAECDGNVSACGSPCF